MRHLLELPSPHIVRGSESEKRVTDRRPGQTRKKQTDLSGSEREERVCGEGGGLYAVNRRG